MLDAETFVRFIAEQWLDQHGIEAEIIITIEKEKDHE